MGQFMKVLVIDRNAAVFSDLDKVMRNDPRSEASPSSSAPATSPTWRPA